MTEVNIELLIEPFRPSEPGEHVLAALEALELAGLVPELGPFATTARGEVDVVASAVGDAIRAAFGRGATVCQARIASDD